MKAEMQVRIKRHHGEPGHLLGIIKRKLKAESIGNFSPIFCTYHGKKHLVSSMAGDLSDPFRRDTSYFDTLYIEI